MATINTDIFISRAKEKHSNFYSYTSTKYTNARTKVVITCPIHGDFEQMPHQHLLGKGCKKCGVTKTNASRAFTTGQFIEKAKALHGDLFDYSLVKYINSTTPVTLVCEKHGVFTVRPKNHIGQPMSGCKQCTVERTADINRTGKDTFIQRAIAAHGRIYDYTKVSFTALKDKVDIECSKHGTFSQSAGSHLSGHGCPKCAIKGFNNALPGTLYFVYLTDYDLYKIGITNLSVDIRLRKENYGLLFSKYFKLGYDAFLNEQIFIRNNLHLQYKGNKVMTNNGNTELFDLKLGAPKDEFGQHRKHEGWTGPEPELQKILDNRSAK